MKFIQRLQCCLSTLVLFASLASISFGVDEDDESILIAGKVVDAQGQPTANVVVNIWRFTHPAPIGTATTSADGRFETKVDVSKKYLRAIYIECANPDDSQIAYKQLSDEKESDWDKLEFRLDVVKKARLVVIDAKEEPVAGATVAARLGNFGRLVSTTTDQKGNAEIRYTDSERIAVAFASKDGMGLDYHLYRLAQQGVGPEFPDGIERFKLTGALPVKLRFADDRNQPLEGIRIYPLTLHKSVVTNTNYNALNLSFFQTIIGKETDSKGEVAFAWIPDWILNSIEFRTFGGTGIVPGSVSVDPRQGSDVVNVTLERTVPIRGKVISPEGMPVKGIEVTAKGLGYSYTESTESANTDAEGNYELPVAPNQIYLVIVKDRTWAASPHSGFAVFRNTPVEGKDFKLRKATRLYGTVRDTRSKLPIDNHRVTLRQVGTGLSEFPEAPFPKPTTKSRDLRPKDDAPSIRFETFTDAVGNFELFVGDGVFDRSGKRFTIAGELSYDMSFEDSAPGVPVKKPELKPLVGLVIDSNTSQPAKDCKITVTPRQSSGYSSDRRSWEATTDVEGKFRAERISIGSFVHAISNDKKSAAIREIKDDKNVFLMKLQPVGAVTGRLMSPDGSKPLSGQKMSCGYIIPPQADPGVIRFGFGFVIEGAYAFVESCVTDADGYFRLDHLAPDVEYKIYVGQTITIENPLATVTVGRGEVRDLRERKAPQH